MSLYRLNAFRATNENAPLQTGRTVIETKRHRGVRAK